ncbi:MAG: hypothetical protein HZA31_10835 [Opitutae bacterium]|nr:hypothetical protein [Opitutae bacterium]
MTPLHYQRILCLTGILFLWPSLALAETHVTRVEIKSRDKTLIQDIVHGMPGFDFKGEIPVLKVVSGAKQTRTAGFLPQPIVIAVYHADGITPWPLAPVTLGVEYGNGGWATNRDTVATSSLTLQADATGRVQAYYWLP